MQLSYRGVSYELNPSDNLTIPGEVIGKYRGAVVRKQHCTNPPVPELFITLQYRGVSYQAAANYSFNSVSDNTFQDERLAISY
ncbi:MAG TPA: hypothetical protein DDW76_13085 [Cyanobacteria bacterium UBA11369]|nr:hypothetical protein [Cyanobacteria bacterium UBA11371]HBE16618.1 hypothetical protein [Cyanobacteria bacterium UBA11367]HBE31597.1 hypothetical protein [Cyanobacteria bacterium UBA11368]HBE49692.1 hypothetical protein [Cyanobacteria bacterium UBA11369]